MKSEVCIWHGVELDAVPGAHVIRLNVLVEPFDSVMKSFFHSNHELLPLRQIMIKNIGKNIIEIDKKGIVTAYTT